MGRTMDVGIGVQLVDLLDEVGLGDVLWEVEIDGPDAHLSAGLALHAHVAL